MNPAVGEIDEQAADDALAVMSVERARVRLQRAWLVEHPGVEPPTFYDRACREVGVSRRTYGRARRRLAKLGIKLSDRLLRTVSGEAAIERLARDRRRRRLREGVAVVKADPEAEPLVAPSAEVITPSRRKRAP